MSTILIVDDLTANRVFLATVLRHEGHRLVEAVDGNDALALVSAEHPDLVLTDVLMPGMDGYELARQLRLDPATRAIPVVFSTAHYGEREARALARTIGVADVLTKPVLSSEILRVVGRALSGAHDSEASEGAPPVPTNFDREHLRLVTDKLSEKAGDLRVANSRLRALINIGLELASERDTTQLLQRVTVAAHELFGASYVTLGIVDPETGTLTDFATCGTDAVDWATCGDHPHGMLKVVVTERRTLRGENPGGDANALKLPHGHPPVHTYLAAPVISPTTVYGWICLVGEEGRMFTEEDEQLVTALSGQIGRIYENEHLRAVAQRRAEELEREMRERAGIEQALHDNERLTHSLVEHLPHRIMVKDVNSVILFCNLNYANDLSLSPEEVVGKDAFAFYPPALAEGYHADDRQVMARGVTKNMEEAYLVGGAQRWVHTVKVPYRDEAGCVIGLLVVFEDITESKLLQEQFHQSQKMEAIGQLAGGVAHDFNNLLTAILGYCELLQGNLPPDDDRLSDVNEIQKAGLSAARLTRQLLAFSRKEIIELKPLDLNEIVTGMQPMLARIIGENIRVVLGLTPGLAPVLADRGQIEQIVMNLAVNARDAMPLGGTLTIGVASVDLDENYPKTHLAVAPGPYVRLTVTDTGTGITPAVQARLFEPFFTTKPPGQGTGLGLATVHGIAIRSGGTVNVYSELGRGSSFKVYLPRVDGVEVVVQPPSGTREFSRGETVLLVEDAEELRELTRRLLERLGYHVLVAANAEEAARLFATNLVIDVILTDVVMPGASGPELSRRLVDQRPSLRVIYMSGYTEEAIVQHGVLIPGIAFLNKPFTSAALGQKLREVLDRGETA
ncbi:MAG: response regulator [Gemmatimonadota bacterium]